MFVCYFTPVACHRRQAEAVRTAPAATCRRVCLLLYPLSPVTADKPKPYRARSGAEAEALRYVAAQPLAFRSGKPNMRALACLPYHLVCARMPAVLKARVLCNYEFLLAKMAAVGFGWDQWRFLWHGVKIESTFRKLVFSCMDNW